MRQKQPTLILSFQTTTQAFAAEVACRAHEIPGRLIPLPREISAGCGLAWSAPPESRERILELAENNRLIYDRLNIILF